MYVYKCVRGKTMYWHCTNACFFLELSQSVFLFQNGLEELCSISYFSSNLHLIS